MKYLVFVLALLSVAAQEKTLPEGQYCTRAERVRSKDAHACDCDYTCETDYEGHYRVQETTICKVYCHHDQCFCHGEVACPKPKA